VAKHHLRARTWRRSQSEERTDTVGRVREFQRESVGQFFVRIATKTSRACCARPRLTCRGFHGLLYARTRALANGVLASLGPGCGKHEAKATSATHSPADRALGHFVGDGLLQRTFLKQIGNLRRSCATLEMIKRRHVLDGGSDTAHAGDGAWCDANTADSQAWRAKFKTSRVSRHVVTPRKRLRGGPGRSSSQSQRPGAPVARESREQPLPWGASRWW